MTVFGLNAVPYGSTGRILLGLADAARAAGMTAYTACSWTKDRGIALPQGHFTVGTAAGKAAHMALARCTGRQGCYSRRATAELLRLWDRLQPDVIHLHNLHGWYLHWPMLFDWLRTAGVPVVWTLHDCWAFTGHCPYFSAVGCEKWRTGCFACPQYRQYPGCYRDDSAFQYALKRRCFAGVTNLQLVCPSRWLADLAGQSFLGDHPIRVLPNGVDTRTFCPTPGDLRRRYAIREKYIVLGAAYQWDARKGVDLFPALARQLGPDYRVVLVGADDALAKQLAPAVLALPRTESPRALAALYTAADVFVNPTREEVQGLVNLEALACGTPVITFATGGSPECIDESCGLVTPQNDLPALTAAVCRVCTDRPFARAACLARAAQFDLSITQRAYLALYRELV